MDERARQTLRQVKELFQHLPDAADQVERVVQGIAGLHRQYKKTHWGDEGERSFYEAEVASTDGGLVELGELVRIDYETRKGKRRPVEIFFHVFDTEPRPRLAFAADGSGLVIVRAGSSYDVTAHGIEG